MVFPLTSTFFTNTFPSLTSKVIAVATWYLSGADTSVNVYFPSFSSNSVTLPSVTHSFTKLPSSFVSLIFAPFSSSPSSVNAFLENLTFVGTSFSLFTIVSSAGFPLLPFFSWKSHLWLSPPVIFTVSAIMQPSTFCPTSTVFPTAKILPWNLARFIFITWLEALFLKFHRTTASLKSSVSWFDLSVPSVYCNLISAPIFIVWAFLVSTFTIIFEPFLSIPFMIIGLSFSISSLVKSK